MGKMLRFEYLLKSDKIKFEKKKRLVNLAEGERYSTVADLIVGVWLSILLILVLRI